MAKPGEGMPPEVVDILGKAPGTEVVLKKVVARLKLESRPASAIAANLDDVLLEMMDEGKRLLEDYQRKAVADLVARYNEVEQEDPERAFEILHKGFISLGNQRKKRAGVHLEICARLLLERCDIPHELGRVEQGRVDNIVPSLAKFKDSPDDCVVLEFKRTIRERWKQIRDEVLRNGVRVWLVTLDDQLSEPLLQAMEEGNVTLFVPDPVHKKYCKGHPRVRSLRTLISRLSQKVKHGLDPA